MYVAKKKNLKVFLAETLTVGLLLVATSHWSPKMLLACILLMVYSLRGNFCGIYITKNANLWCHHCVGILHWHLSHVSKKIQWPALTVCLLTPGPPRQWKPIRRQNWNNRFQHFKIQPIKCPVQNNEISTCSLTGDVYVTMVSVKCEAQTSRTFMCLRL